MAATVPSSGENKKAPTRSINLREASFASAHEVHAHLAEALRFPPHYCANFAALSDCLGDVSEPTLVDVTRDGRAATPEYAAFFERLCVVLARAALENENLRVNIQDERA